VVGYVVSYDFVDAGYGDGVGEYIDGIVGICIG